jgi:hypothetical protein
VQPGTVSGAVRARDPQGLDHLGDQANESYGPTWKTYAYNSLLAAE